MRPAKVTGLAIFLSEPAHATGVSAMVAGILEAFTWVVIAVAVATALLWLTRKSKRITTSRSTPPPRP